MSKAVRLQLSRKRGFNLQKLSRETNGLEAVNVARPSIFGNPFVDLQGGVLVGNNWAILKNIVIDAADAYRFWLDGKLIRCEAIEPLYRQRQAILAGLPALADKNLACWCHDRHGVHCHADVLLALANPGDRG